VGDLACVGGPDELAMTSGQTQIVVGISTSLSGLAALRFAVAEARRRGLRRITAVRTWPDYGHDRPTPWAPDRRLACLAQIDTAVATAFATRPIGVQILPRMPPGYPGKMLIRIVEDDGDLIVVGTGRRLRLGGGVGGYCARHAACPVVIVPPPVMAGRAPTRRITRSVRRELDRLNAEGPASPMR
jgi:nucleotide-binding universal stress UspA family protein